MRIRTSAAPLAAVLALGLLAGCSSSAPEAEPEETDAAADAPLYDQLPDAIKDAGVITIAGDTHPHTRTQGALAWNPPPRFPIAPIR